MDAGVKAFVMIKDDEREKFSACLNMLEKFAVELANDYDDSFIRLTTLLDDTEILVAEMRSWLRKYDRGY